MRKSSNLRRRIAIGLIFTLTTVSLMGQNPALSVAGSGTPSVAEDELLHIIDAKETSAPVSFEKNDGQSTNRKEAGKDRIQTAAYEPWTSDMGYSEQWHLEDIGAPQVWSEIEAQGRHPGDGIVVAVVDTGVDTNHYDLKNNLWTNTAELNGITGVDDDNNGYVDDIYGANIVNPEAPMDDTNGHGTQMAGIIAMGVGNQGAVGVAYGAKVMSVKVAVGDTFSSDDAVKGIQYAVENGADIISMSYSTQTISEKLYTALKEASKKCILVAASGNESLTTDEPSYPAAYNFVIGVMSYGKTHTISSFSNWDNHPGEGDDYDIAAPGEDIVTTIPGGYHTRKNGTSHATAVVSGELAVALERLRAKGEKPDPYSFQMYFIRNMSHWTSADAAHNYLLFPRPYLPDVVDTPTTPLVTMTPVPSATPTPVLTPVPTVAPTVAPTIAPTVLPTSSAAPTVTEVPGITPTAAPTVAPTPTKAPSDSKGKLAKGLVLKAGSGAKKAFYQVKNPTKRTVVYYLCNVSAGKKTASIPSRIRLTDGSEYRIVGVKKRSFIYKKQVKTVNVFAQGITRSKMSRAIRGSGVTRVIFK